MILNKLGSNHEQVGPDGKGKNNNQLNFPARHRRQTCVPNLSLDGFALVLDAACGKLDADGRLGLEVKLIASEPRQQIGLANPRVTDQHHLEKIIILVVRHAAQNEETICVMSTIQARRNTKAAMLSCRCSVTTASFWSDRAQAPTLTRSAIKYIRHVHCGNLASLAKGTALIMYNY